MSNLAIASRSRWVMALVALLLLATAMFVVGVAVERHQALTESSSTPGQETSGGETGEHVEGGSEGAEAVQVDHSTSEATILGVDPESTLVVVVAVVLAALLAAATWWRPAPAILLIGIVFCLAALMFDIREATHQIDESRTGVASLAGLVALLHLLAAGAAAAALMAVTRPSRHVVT